MKQDPPWKVGLPFALGVVMASASWCFSRQPLALLAAAILAVWGTLWVYGAWRSLGRTAREAATPPFAPPAAGQALALSRARRGFSPRRGYLMMTADDLIWWPGTPPRPLRPADRVALADLYAWGPPPHTLVPLSEIDGLRHVPGFIGADTLTLMSSAGRPIRLSLFDPEGFVLILGSFEESGEA